MLINKQHRFILLCLTILLTACTNQETVSQLDSDQPNILLIITDDQRYDALGIVQQMQDSVGRYPWLSTPNLDQLAREGVLFTNAFVTTSLCSPSRAAILTGQYNHLNGIEDNSTNDFNQVSFASLLQGKGYETGYFGKWHMGNARGKRPGFDHSYSFIGQGDYFDVPFEIDGMPEETQGWVDEVSTNYLLEKIKDYHNHPFCYVIGYKTAHGPWDAVPKNVEQLYAQDRPNEVENIGVRPPYIKARYRNRQTFEKYWNKFQSIDRNYFRSITAVDQQIGRILKTLETAQLTENTVVIFMSDNGFFHGEHLLIDKRAAYEESIRIPLIIRVGKGKKINTQIDQLALNIDIAPTILELAGLTIPNTIQGASLLPLMNGQANDWRDAFIYRFKHEPNFALQTSMTALRTESHKLIIYDGQEEWTELFDLTIDPYEVDNLKEDKELLDAHIKQLEQLKEAIQLE